MRARTTILTLVVMLLAGCGGTSGSTEAAPEPAAEASATEEPVIDDGPEPTSVTASEPPGDAVDAACPSRPAIPDLAPVTGAADFPAGGSGLAAGTYGSTMLGVSFAVDVPDGFDDAGAFGDNVVLFGPWDPTVDTGAVVSLGRPAGYAPRFRTQEEVELGEPRPIVDLSTWLQETGVEVLADEQVTVADRDARLVRFIVTEDLLPDDDFADVPVTPDVGAQVGEFEHLLVEVALEIGAPLIIYAAGPGDGFPASAMDIVDSLVIGDVAERPKVTFAETPWDSGNLFQPKQVEACLIPAVAFDGVTFEVPIPAKIMGTGDELWVFETEGRHRGFTEPHVNIVRPDTTAEGGSSGPPSPGGKVATIDDALAEFEAEGYVLDPLGDVGTLLGAPAVGYDFLIETDEPWLWVARSHAASRAIGFAPDQGNWEGTVYLAEVGDGVLIVSVGGEIGTDDVDLVRPLFADIVATLSPAD